MSTSYIFIWTELEILFLSSIYTWIFQFFLLILVIYILLSNLKFNFLEIIRIICLSCSINFNLVNIILSKSYAFNVLLHKKLLNIGFKSTNTSDFSFIILAMAYSSCFFSRFLTDHSHSINCGYSCIIKSTHLLIYIWLAELNLLLLLQDKSYFLALLILQPGKQFIK